MSMILLFHARLLYGFHIGINAIDNTFAIGAICVTVFFMLSGYGLRKSNQKLNVTDASALRCYFIKRFLSIYPLYLLLQIVALLFSFRVDGLKDVWTWLIPVQLTMTQVLAGPDVYQYLFNDNCWYLSALFILYLLFPLLNESIHLLHRRIASWSNRSRSFLLIGFIILMIFASETIYLHQIYYVSHHPFLYYYPNPLFRIPEFYIGMLVADLDNDKNVLQYFQIGKHTSIILLVCFIIGFVGLQILYPHVGLEYNLYNIIVIPCTVVMILCVAGSECLNRLGGSFFAQRVAGMGLELYLCQSFAILMMERVGITSHHGIWFIGLSVVIAILVHLNFTRNVLKLLRG